MATPVKQETTVQVPPSQVKFWDTAVGKTARAAIYLAISAVVATVLADLQNNPTLFGVYTPIINLVLVAVKGLVDPSVKNV